MLKKKRLVESRESMTLPDERYRAVKNTMEFLIRLSAGEYPRVPRGVREEARSLLRHYPGTFDLDQIERAAPHVLQQRMEPLHKMVLQYSNEDLRSAADDHEGSTLD
jgi:hypothetical protein